MNKHLVLALASLVFLVTACEKSTDTPIPGDIDFRQEMRQLVQSISAYGHFLDDDFLVIPQNGEDIITIDGEPEGTLATGYINAIDGIGREELFYGYDNHDNQPTPNKETSYMLPYLNLLQQSGKIVLITDYTSDTEQRAEATDECYNRGFLSFVAPDRELSVIPDSAFWPTASGKVITRLSQAENFLYLINPEKFSSREAYIQALAATPYDILLIDLYFDDPQAPLTTKEVSQLRLKPDGSSRLLIAYLSIGEAESYRYYWQAGWNQNPPYWMEAENADWDGNFKIRYWEQDWKDILIGNKDSYVKKIVDAGFDGVYLDVVDAYEYFE
ncbi:MAG: endo alpha-1,4 polygalactosaminidase [Saprospiraceae bacterium]